VLVRETFRLVLCSPMHGRGRPANWRVLAIRPLLTTAGNVAFPFTPPELSAGTAYCLNMLYQIGVITLHQPDITTGQGENFLPDSSGGSCVRIWH